MRYDYDVIVIGGGPAGLTAAIRTRWVKRYKSVPCSTLLIENSTLGGLASWRGCLFTGPSWKIKGNDGVRRLLKDIEGFNIESYPGRVSRVNLRGEIKEVFISDGKVFRSLAVIMATGIKVLVNEKDYLGCGLEVTSMGYEFIVSHLKKLLGRRWKPRLVIVGSEKLNNLIPLIRDVNTAGSPLLFVMEGEGEDSGDVVRGWVERYWGKGHLQGITLRTSKGLRKIGCERVLLDFNSYELSPSWQMEVDAGGLTTPFIRVNADMETTLPGVFAAGDVTSGGYNSFSRAVAQGVTAGLSAYSYVYQKKFGMAPPLFAYRPTDFVIPSDVEELPPLDDRLQPKSLVAEEKLRALLGKKWASLSKSLRGDLSLRELARREKVPVEDLKNLLRRMVEKKAVTFHIEVSG